MEWRKTMPSATSILLFWIIGIVVSYGCVLLLIVAFLFLSQRLPSKARIAKPDL
jgi:hypothetical protein